MYTAKTWTSCKDHFEKIVLIRGMVSGFCQINSVISELYLPLRHDSQHGSLVAIQDGGQQLVTPKNRTSCKDHS